MSSSGVGHPLSPAALYILLALSGQATHGYGILKEVERQSARQYRMGPGTLYDNLRKLMDAGLVVDREERDCGESRRLYQLTQSGAELLSSELESLRRLLQTGRKRLRLWQSEGRV